MIHRKLADSAAQNFSVAATVCMHNIIKLTWQASQTRCRHDILLELLHSRCHQPDCLPIKGMCGKGRIDAAPAAVIEHFTTS